MFFMQNFKREEQNFVVQNEINNLSFLTGDSKTKMSKVGVLSDRFKKVFAAKNQMKQYLIAGCGSMLCKGLNGNVANI